MRSTLPGMIVLANLLSSSALAHAQDPSWDVTKARGTTREIDFTTSEGTWMSLDVTPDGQWVVFNLLGHIYRVSTAGGQAECLTQASGIALNYHPRVSPDGKTVAFISDRSGQSNVWLMDLDGSHPRPLTNGNGFRFQEPSWSPDGQYIVVRRLVPPAGRFTLVVFHRDGGDGNPVVGVDQNGVPGSPKYSADGRSIYYHTIAQATSGYRNRTDPVRGDVQIQRLELSTGRVEHVTRGESDQSENASSGGAFAPEPSPDGRYLAFARRVPDGQISYKGQTFGPRTALWIRDLETGAERLLMDPIETDFAQGIVPLDVILPGYRWASDGQSIVLTQGGKIHRVDVASGRVTTIPFTARVHRTISERVTAVRRLDDGPVHIKFPTAYTASPDGRTLAFQAVGRIWLMDLPSGEPRRLTDSTFTPQEYQPAWSPDGKSIVFASWDDGNQGHLWRVDAAGGRPAQVTKTAGEYLEPVWSPSGDSIVAARGAGATARGQSLGRTQYWELISLPIGGGKASTIVRLDAAEGGAGVMEYTVPRANFANGRVYFAEASRGRRLLVSVRMDGSDRREHLAVTGAGEIVVSPGGRWVGFMIGGNAFVAPLWPGTIPGAVPVIGSAGGPLPVTRLTWGGGTFLRWRDAETITYGSGPKFFWYNVRSKHADSTTTTLTVPRAFPHGSVAITGARILTMEGRKTIARGSIIVRAGRITCVGGCSTAGVDKVVDVGGRTVMPGLVDMHAHHAREYPGIQPAHNYESAIYLAYGVTTTFDPGPSFSINIFPQAELTEAGGMIGPRRLTTAEVMSADENAWNNPISSVDDAYREAMRRVGWGAITLKSYLQPDRRHMQWLLEGGRRAGVTVTAEGSLDLEHKLSMVMDGYTGAEHSTALAPLYSDFTRFLGMAQFAYSTTPLVGGPGPWNEEYWWQESDLWKDPKLQQWTPWRQLIPHTRRRILRPKSDYAFGMMAQAAADIVAAGGLAPIGSHGEQNGIGSHWDVWMYAEAMGPMGALEAATLHGAKFMGLEQDLGSIAVGKLGDLVVLNADPLLSIRNTTNIRYVMKGGVLYDATSLDELWPIPRKFGGYYWNNPEAYRSDVRPVEYYERRKTP